MPMASTTATLDLRGATLAEAAALVDVDLVAPFEAGHDTPPVGDPTAPLAVDRDDAAALAEREHLIEQRAHAVLQRARQQQEPWLEQLPEPRDATQSEALAVIAAYRDRWRITTVHRDGSIDVQHLRNHNQLTLPADSPYVGKETGLIPFPDNCALVTILRDGFPVGTVVGVEAGETCGIDLEVSEGVYHVTDGERDVEFTIEP